MGNNKKNLLNSINQLPDRQGKPVAKVPTSGFKILFGDYESYEYPISEDIQNDLGEIFHLTEETDNPQTFIKRTLEAIEKYPDLPQLHNSLYSAYKYTGLNREYRKVLRETYQRFPNYFMVKVDYARFSIEEDRPRRVEEIFNHEYEINLAFPDRPHFHVNEVLSFYEVMTLFFLKIGSLNAATTAHKVLKDLSPDNPEVRKLGLSIAAATMGL
jgi:hypothetical protein